MRGSVSCARHVSGLTLTLGMVAGFIAVSLLSFRVGATPLAPPEAPAPLSPVDRSWTNNPDSTFAWSETEGDIGYELRYAKTADCTVDSEASLGHEGQFAAAEAVVAVTLRSQLLVEDLAEGQWCWQVRAAHAVGGYSAWSQPRAFSVDTTLPVLAVTHPPVPGRFSGTVDEIVTMEFILDGTARPDIAVSLSPTPNADATYDWSLTLPQLPDGDHTYALRAVDRAGNEKTTVPASFTVESPSGKPSVITSTHHEMLPLLPLGPLVFITAPSPEEPSDINLMSPVIDATTAQPMAIEAPHRIGQLAAAHIDRPVSDDPVRATEKGWVLFGVGWYWWVFGAGLMAATMWIVLLRIRLASRLGWIGAV